MGGFDKFSDRICVFQWLRLSKRLEDFSASVNRASTPTRYLAPGDGRLSKLVNMVRNSAEPGGRDLFSCSPDAWSLLLEIGMAFGWKAQGASYVRGEIAGAPDNPARHDYQPGDVQDSKLVDAADALDWAKALSEARSSPHLAAMIGDRPQAAASHDMPADALRSADAPFSTILDEFITYAFGGEFVFFRT